MNAMDILIIMGVAAVIIASFVIQKKRDKAGKCSCCSGSCGSCGMKCHKS